jgi:hypothetical protein
MSYVNTCVIPGCGRLSDTFMCSGCWGKLERSLGDVAWIAEELDTTLARLDKLSGASVGYVRRSDEQRMPPNMHASQAGDELRQILGLWVRDLHETHAPRWQECDGCGGQYFAGEQVHDREDCQGEWIERLDPLDIQDTAVALSRWLLRHPTWIRSHSAAEELYEEIRDVILKARRAIDRAPDTVYVGQCSALIEDVMCEEDLYGITGRDTVTCRTCGTEHAIEGRRQILVGAMEDQLLTATEISQCFPAWFGKPVSASMVRGWKHRGRVRSIDQDGQTLYRVGNVLDILTRPKKEAS